MENIREAIEEVPMMMPKVPSQSAVPARVPVDLSDWVGRHGLACLALEAATEIGTRAFAGLFAGDQAGRTRAKTMLALLTYCYGAGVYASDEIELRAMNDPMVRYLAGNVEPGWCRLRAFRRQWRGTIHESLARLMALAWSQRRRSQERDPMAGACFAMCETHDLEPSAAKRWDAEAECRIGQAVLLDSMFADD